MNLTDWSSFETNLKLSVNDAPADFKCAILAAMDYSVCFPNEPPLDLAADGEIFERLPAKVCAWVLKAIGEMRINQRKWTSKSASENHSGNNWHPMLLADLFRFCNMKLTTNVDKQTRQLYLEISFTHSRARAFVLVRSRVPSFTHACQYAYLCRAYCKRKVSAFCVLSTHYY